MRPGPIIPLLLLVFATLLGEPPAGAQTVDEVLARHLAARGGGEALSKVQSLRFRGSLDLAGLKASMTVRYRRPDKVRIDVELAEHTDTRIYDGSMGWGVVATRGQVKPPAFRPYRLSGDDLAFLRRQADTDGPLVDPVAKGHRVELLGRGGDGAGAGLVRLQVTHSDGAVVMSYLDPVTWLEVRQEFSMKIAGQPVDVILTMEDYRPVDGLMLAHTFIQSFVGLSVGTKFTVETVEVNPELADEVFGWPGPAKAQQGGEATGRCK